MIQSKSHYWRGTELVGLYGEGTSGAPSQQLEDLVQRCWTALGAHSLAAGDVVFTRLWMRDRADAAGLAEVRERVLRGPARSASSSFYSHDHFIGSGAVALELFAFRAVVPQTRRIVDFVPARRYAHYMMQDDWLFLSGMAEEGDSMDQQFDRAFAEVQKALEMESLTWRNVTEATLFLERGRADIEWFRKRMVGAVTSPPRMSFEYVDGLATPTKNLEIEIIAHRPPPPYKDDRDV